MSEAYTQVLRNYFYSHSKHDTMKLEHQESTNQRWNILDAQQDMRQGYANGSIGIIVSGMMWFIAAFVAFQYSPKQGVWALLIGGTLIHPVSIMAYKAIGMKGAHSQGNPLAQPAMEGTIWMILCLPLVFGLSLQHLEWFFQGMMLIIGGRYLTFASLYGIRLYWILGGTLAGVAYLLFGFHAQPFTSALTGASIEAVVGFVMLIDFWRKR
jgi:hypothetical protein